MTETPEEIRAPARLDNLYTLLEFVTSRARRCGAGPERLREIELALEELLVNIFNYAYPDGAGEVTIRCRRAGVGRLAVEIADDGIPFDILTRAEPDLDAPLDERGIGGLGIFFVRQLVPEIGYRREGGKNILTLAIDLSPQSPGTSAP